MFHDYRTNSLIINLLLSQLSISTDEAPKELQMGCDKFSVSDLKDKFNNSSLLDFYNSSVS
jgi:hypothetical protein